MSRATRQTRDIPRGAYSTGEGAPATPPSVVVKGAKTAATTAAASRRPGRMKGAKLDRTVTARRKLLLMFNKGELEFLSGIKRAWELDRPELIEKVLDNWDHDPQRVTQMAREAIQRTLEKAGANGDDGAEADADD